jgi:N-acetyl-alpha-D-glucosaminyl L-malate synthase BshA
LRIGICCYPTHGGSGVVATELGKHLAERGHEISFVSYETPLRLGTLPERVSYHEVEIEQYPLLKHFPYTLALASKLAEVARLQNLDILHAHYAIPFGAAALLARQIVSERPVKVVMTLHGTDITLVGNNASFKPVTKMAIEQADAVTVVSRYLREETHRQFEVDRDLEVIYNFIDPERHENDPCPCVPACSRLTQKTLMHISNFRPVKRIRDVVAVFAKVSAVVNSRLVLVGDGPDRPLAVETAKELGVLDRVRFVGVVDQVATLLNVADLFLLPSSTESFGLVDGVTGFLAPVGDVDRMAAYATDLLRDERKRRLFGSAGRERARDQFDYQKIVPQYEAVYERILAR